MDNRAKNMAAKLCVISGKRQLALKNVGLSKYGYLGLDNRAKKMSGIATDLIAKVVGLITFLV